jgi:hypothetical protein
VTTLVDHAKQILRDAGYVVIPRDRHGVVRVERAMSVHLIEGMKEAAERKRLLEYEEGVAAQQIGRELMLTRAITRTDIGYDWGMHAYRRRWEASVILPG